MFTGIIENLVKIISISQSDQGLRMKVAYQNAKDPLKRGESVAMNGVCLTVADCTPESFAVDVVKETICSTTLGQLKVDESANIERSLRIGDRLGGHFVFGHVDGVGRILKIVRSPEHFLLAVGYPKGIKFYLAEKGSIAVDGVSLTIQQLTEFSFTVAIIPHTAAVTNLGTKKEGDLVNIEVDMLARYARGESAAREVQTFPFTVASLREHGF